MSFTDDELNAIKSFDPANNRYLSVEGKGENKKLQVVERNWFGRLLMKLGWSSSSFAQVANYILTKDLSSIKPALTDATMQKGFQLLQKKLIHYSENHPQKRVVLQALLKLKLTSTSSIPQVTHAANEQLKTTLARMIFTNHELPGAGGSTKKTGEEHINAMLYQYLIEEKKRSDVVILPLLDNQLPASLDIHFHSPCRYVVAALSVNRNTHNTVLVIDKEKNVYHYFDSLEPKSDCPMAIKETFQKAGLLTAGCTKALGEGSVQTDGWSCGFHAVENAIQCIENGFSVGSKRLDGNQLRTKYAPYFNRFAESFGKTENKEIEERLNKRQKTTLRDALKLIATSESHPVYELFTALKKELDAESSTRNDALITFVKRYQETHPIDRVGLQILLEAIDPSGTIAILLPKQIAETQEVSLQREVDIRQAIEKLTAAL